ncbi:methionyl-tRNA formyltransferase [Humibacter ginsenosidimutans]|uniref:Methionyl-tRNA formyltransferase n=1 Tax=Humibacter ginsenosidimutans TaxID=2599293 RepID=A0A5B8M1V4_9MICO|nr:methionyl-tRNA formyltransferase [Humibacter ginsenosidimutans]QDZ13825.1 methionyl-tRNA formyltransferase [Humibacter ginsenosidimutans]
MRIAFAGTPQAAVPTLRALAAGPHEIVTVVTRPDAPLGRKRVLTPSPVAIAAAQLGLPVVKARRLDEEATASILDARPELGVVVAYGGLVREPLLSAPEHGWINLHFSLLPRWRGAAPVQRALIAGDQITGAAVFRLVPELDAGDVYDMVEHPIGPDDTAGELLDALAVEGAELVARVVDSIATGSAVAVAQEGEPTLAPKLGLDDARLDLTRDAAAVYARLRGVTPEPGAFVTVAGTRVKVLAAARSGAAPLVPGQLQLVGVKALIGTATTPLHLITVQPAGKRPMPGADWLRGLPARATAEVAA